MKQAVLPGGQAPFIAITMFAQLCHPQANEMEMGATLFIQMMREGHFLLTQPMARSTRILVSTPSTESCEWVTSRGHAFLINWES